VPFCHEEKCIKMQTKQDKLFESSSFVRFHNLQSFTQFLNFPFHNIDDDERTTNETLIEIHSIGKTTKTIMMMKKRKGKRRRKLYLEAFGDKEKVN